MQGVADNSSLLKAFNMYLSINKSTYLMMNRLRMEQKGHRYLTGLVWLPKKLANKAIEMLRDNPRLTSHFDEVQKHTLTPPTFFEMNDFIWPFHEIVVTYGTPNYKEVNPTIFNMVTFPFLFGVMFGDIGHGGLLFIFGIFLCLRNAHI